MQQSIVHVALVVDDYDEAIDFHTHKLHFTLVEDTDGLVAVFEDLYGNLWDLLELTPAALRCLP